MSMNVFFMDSKQVGGNWAPKYGAADFNNIIKTMATPGVVNENDTSCQVITGDTSATVKVMPGRVIMQDGSTAEISGAPETVTLASTTAKNYVYFKRDYANNTISLLATTAAPTGDYVMLAEVTGSNIVDKRMESSFTLTRGLGNSYFVKKNLSLTFPSMPASTKFHEIDLGSKLFKGAVLTRVVGDDYKEILRFSLNYDFVDGSYVAALYYVDSQNNSYGSGIATQGLQRFTWGSSPSIMLNYNNGILEFWGRNAGSAITFSDFNLTVY